ncbi:MAG TPA: hypothetical protein ACHBZA_06295 [Arsenophonus apicola]|nr:MULTISPECIES: hypothetical protein [Arsenophonus]UBX29474.1 hypothetical protein LDL57_01920 [Arsenophonus apicola]
MRAMRQGVKEGDTVRSAQLDDIQQFLHPELKRFFPAAFLGRLQVIPYLPVEGEILQKIIQYKLAKIVTRFEKATQVLLSYSDSLVEYLADQCLIAESGAREIDNLLLQQVLPLLSDSLLSGDMLNKSQIYLDVHNNRVCFKAISSDK